MTEIYNDRVKTELKKWRRRVTRKPSLTDRIAKSTQDKINSMIPEKVHNAITAAIKQMVKGVLYGSVIGKPKVVGASLEEREIMIGERLEFYRNTAAVEGGVTGMGGIISGLADFPLLLGIKLKFLYDIAAIYGYDLNDLRERIYLLHIFQLAFSSPDYRIKIFEEIDNWEQRKQMIPDDINSFDWRNFQQQYRDHIDLAKLAQLIPVIGAVVGVVVNYRLLTRLGETATNAYRLRWLAESRTT